jgi:hypothetical protein
VQRDLAVLALRQRLALGELPPARDQRLFLLL